MTRLFLRRLYRSIFCRDDLRRLNKFYDGYVERDIPSTNITIYLPTGETFTGTLLGHDKTHVYVRYEESNFNWISVKRKVDVVCVEEKPEHRECTILAMHQRAQQMRFDDKSEYLVHPHGQSFDKFRTKCRKVAREENETFIIGGAFTDDLKLLSFFVHGSLSFNYQAYFAHELTIVEQEEKTNV